MCKQLGVLWGYAPVLCRIHHRTLQDTPPYSAEHTGLVLFLFCCLVQVRCHGPTTATEARAVYEAPRH